MITSVLRLAAFIIKVFPSVLHSRCRRSPHKCSEGNNVPPSSYSPVWGRGHQWEPALCWIAGARLRSKRDCCVHTQLGRGTHRQALAPELHLSASRSPPAKRKGISVFSGCEPWAFRRCTGFLLAAPFPLPSARAHACVTRTIPGHKSTCTGTFLPTRKRRSLPR